MSPHPYEGRKSWQQCILPFCPPRGCCKLWSFQGHLPHFLHHWPLGISEHIASKSRSGTASKARFWQHDLKQAEFVPAHQTSECISLSFVDKKWTEGLLSKNPGSELDLRGNQIRNTSPLSVSQCNMALPPRPTDISHSICPRWPPKSLLHIY